MGRVAPAGGPPVPAAALHAAPLVRMLPRELPEVLDELSALGGF